MTGTFLEMIVVYTLKITKVEVEVIEQIIESIPPRAKENIMTTYAKLIQKTKQEGEQIGIQIGMEKGEQIGMQKGKIEGKIEVILSSHKQGLSVSLIANITNMDEKQVLDVLKEHKKL